MQTLSERIGETNVLSSGLASMMVGEDLNKARM